MLFYRACLLSNYLRCMPELMHTLSRSAMNLSDVISSLNEYASLSLAESWDNVGLLVEPRPPHTVSTLFLTNDLTERVMEEAVSNKADLILSYHPPIFKALTRVTWKAWKERIVITALENRIAVYSPHTAYDALPNGVNDWLAKSLGECISVPLHPAAVVSVSGKVSHKVEFTVGQNVQTIILGLKEIQEISFSTYSVVCNEKSCTRISVSCTQQALIKLVKFLSKEDLLQHGMDIVSLQKPPLPNSGMGRLCTLTVEASLATIINQIKNHLRLPYLRLALGVGKTLDCPVKVAAICAGSGASVLRGVAADLYLTGEMSHHDVLDAIAQGISVILCDHSNTERGFLEVLKESLSERFNNQIKVLVSRVDCDPMKVV